jgi:hypothetical protein
MRFDCDADRGVCKSGRSPSTLSSFRILPDIGNIGSIFWQQAGNQNAFEVGDRHNNGSHGDGRKAGGWKKK